MVPFTQKERYSMEDLRNIIHLLRHEGGCPWDMAQTHESILRDLMEETCELTEAIRQKNPAGMEEELGDVLMQVLFHADLEEDAGRFDLDDVVDHIAKKMIYRHPHVFGEVQVDGVNQVWANWEALKRQEKHQTTYTDTLDAVARTLPALWRAEKVLNKAAKAGFQWPDVLDAVDKVAEEAGELHEAVSCAVCEDEDATEAVAEELGDLLFASVNVARYSGLDPEAVLHAATEKFIHRFAQMEQLAGNVDLRDISSPELVTLWNRAKEGEGV